MNVLHDEIMLPPLLSEKEWAEQKVVDYLREQLSAQLSPLDRAEQLNYRNLIVQYSEALIAVESQCKKIRDEFDEAGIRILKDRLLALTGKDVDPRHMYLHTRYLYIPEHRAQRAAPNTDTDNPVVEHVPEPVIDHREPIVRFSTMSLWQAACLNIGFLAYFSSFRSQSLVETSYINDQPGVSPEFVRASTGHINASMIDVSVFVGVVREINLGRRLTETLERAVSSQQVLAERLRHSIKAQLQFSVLELYRRVGDNQPVKEKVKFMADALEKKSNRLRVKKIIMQIDFNFFEKLTGHGFTPQRGLIISTAPGAETETEGHHIDIPLFQIEHKDSAGVFSFFPGRPNGELQFHASDTQLVDEFKRQFVTAYTENNLDWFYRKLTPQTYKKVIELTRVTSPPPNLTPFAQLLYDAFQVIGARKPIEEVKFKRFKVGTVVEDELYSFYLEHYLSRLKLLAVERSDQDWEDIKQALSTVFDETVSLLLTPIPGSITGLSRILRYLVIGAIGHNLVIGLEQAGKGEGTPLLITLTDVLDVLINAPLYTSLGRASRQRHLKVLNDLGNPRKLTGPDGRPQLWYPDPVRYVLAPPDVIERMRTGEQRIYSYEGHHYVSLEKDNRRYSVEVEREGTGEQYVLVHANPSVYRPPIEFNSSKHHWQLALDDSPALTSDQLLRRMVPDLWASEAQVMLNISGIDRATLDAVWAGGHVPASLSDAIVRFHADRLIERIGREFSLGQTSRVPLERPVLALLTQLDEWPSDISLKVFDHRGNVSEVYSKPWYSAAFSRSIELKRLFDGQLVLNTVSLFKAFPEDTLNQIVKLLPGAQREPAQINQSIVSALKKDRTAIFESLTLYKDYTRTDRVLAKVQDRNYYPAVLNIVNPYSEGIRRLRETHPGLSRARCEQLIREYPLLEHQYPSAVSSEQERHRLQAAVRRANFLSRSERMVDSIYHARSFNADACLWIEALSTAYLKQKFGLVLEIYTLGQQSQVPPLYASDNQIVLFSYGTGEYAAYDPYERLIMPKETGVDGFFIALMTGFFIVRRARGWQRMPLQEVAQWRKALGDELVQSRTREGYFSVPLQKNEEYAASGIIEAEMVHPAHAGYFFIKNKLYIVIDGLAYHIQQEIYGYQVKVTHPTMFARVPLQVYGNGMGAWRHANEQPLLWEGRQLFLRLGYTATGFNSDEIDAILKVSGATDEVLRRVHVNLERVPGLLSDTLQRFTNFHRLETLLAHQTLDSDREFMSLIFDVFHTYEQAGLLTHLSGSQKVKLQDLFTAGAAVAPWIKEDEQAGRYIQWVYHQFKNSAAEITPSSFELVNTVTEYSIDPCVVLILQAFPSLSVKVAEDVVYYATNTEIDHMNLKGRVPLRVAQEARWYVRELRLSRAFEGFYWSTLQNNDSVKLLLHALGTLRGWPTDVYIEVREGPAVEPLISESGPRDALRRLSIIKTVEGWQASNEISDAVIAHGKDFFRVVLSSLPAAQRQALGYFHAGGDTQLKEILTTQITQQRDVAYQVLGMPPERPWFNRPKRLESGRLGYELSGRGTAIGLSAGEVSIYARYKALYPAKTSEQVARDVRAMAARGLNAADEITRLKAESDRLEEQLSAWIVQQKNLAPWDIRALDNNRRIADRLIKVWRKESPAVIDETGRLQGYQLELDGLQTSKLPLLDVSFAHVRSLSMTRMGLTRVSPENINHFLQNFSALTSLNMEHSGLVFFATAIEQMRDLVELSLANNTFTLAANNLINLGQLVHLHSLNLSGCSLLGVLDVRGMTQLRTLNLSRTDALGWPLGVEHLPHLRRLNLSNNLIFEIPDLLLQGDEYERINRVTNLFDNDLSVASLQRLQSYQRRTGINFGLHPEETHPLPVPLDSQPWLQGLTPADRQALQDKWDSLVDEPGSEQFFELLDRLKTTADYEKAHDDLMRRVRATLEAAAQDEKLRSALFHLASNRVTCCDSVALIFTALETEVLVFDARSAVDPQLVELNLVRLRRGQFRLQQVDSIALSDAEQRRGQAQAVDEVELVLSYRLALAQALELPGQPKNIKFGSLVKIKDTLINAAKASILAMDNSDEMLSYMTKESYWVEFLEALYPEKFAANTEQKAEIDFEALSIAGSRSYEDSNANFENWKRDRQAILVSLTRDALAKLDASQAAAPE